jgi:hypothetical protein
MRSAAMTDIYCGMSLMLLLSAACFAATRRAVRGVPLPVCDLLAAIVVVAICAHIRWMWDDVRLARWLPFSNLIVVGNWYLLLAGALAGLAWRRIEASPLRRWAILVLLLGSSVYTTMRPVLGVPPRCDDQSEPAQQGRLYYQTTESTCTAAAAATLLSLHGIASDEQEMAELCLTRDGTTWKGLYRGLKLKTSQTCWNIEVFRGGRSDLLSGRQPPLILWMQLASDHPYAAGYRAEWGWIPGTAHTVVLLGRTRGGEYLMHDPVAGKEVWTEDDLDALWTGQGMRLVAASPEQAARPAIIAGLLQSIGR